MIGTHPPTAAQAYLLQDKSYPARGAKPMKPIPMPPMEVEKVPDPHCSVHSGARGAPTAMKSGLLPCKALVIQSNLLLLHQTASSQLSQNGLDSSPCHTISGDKSMRGNSRQHKLSSAVKPGQWVTILLLSTARQLRNPVGKKYSVRVDKALPLSTPNL